jgi:hypothetical protein
LTPVVKFPLASAFAPPATFVLGGSQYSVMCSLARKAPPLTVMLVVTGPVATSRVRKALAGIGEGLGDGDGVGEAAGVGEACGVGVGVDRAMSRSQTGSRARTLSNLIRSSVG